MAFPSISFLFNVPMPPMPVVWHHAEYSLKVAESLLCGRRGVTLEGSLLAGGWRQKPLWKGIRPKTWR